MSRMASDDFLSDLTLTDPWVAAITPQRIEHALSGFQLSLTDGWSLERLTEAIQQKANAARWLPRQGDAEAIKELEKLAAKAKALRGGISRMGSTAQDAALIDLLFRAREHDKNASVSGEDYQAALINSLQLIEHVLSRAASQLATHTPQSSRWTQRDRKERRVAFAIDLMPIFEVAFATPVRANNWALEYGKEHPWQDFYRRIYSELVPDAKNLNLSEVLQEAVREMPELRKFQAWLDEQEAIRE